MKRENVNGGWVDFREPQDVPERLRRKVTTMSSRASKVAGRLEGENPDLQTEDLEFLLEFNDAISICLVMGWSWDNPVTIEGLLDLPASVYDFIVRHGQANVANLLPNFEVDPDPKAPTENLNVSETHSVGYTTHVTQ